MIIYEYEVELKAFDRITQTATIVKRTEHAYSVSEAFMQALYNQNATHNGTADITLIHIGPPAAAVEAATATTKAMIESAMKRISEMSK